MAEAGVGLSAGRLLRGCRARACEALQHHPQRGLWVYGGAQRGSPREEMQLQRAQAERERGRGWRCAVLVLSNTKEETEQVHERRDVHARNEVLHGNMSQPGA
jgi:hypothetical protein